MLADTSMKVILVISFLYFSNIDMKFAKLRKLTWWSYNTIEVLFTTYIVKLINTREFAKVVLNKNSKTYILYITALKTIKTVDITIYLLLATWIAVLQLDNISTKPSAIDTNYVNVFSFNRVIKLLKNIDSNKYIIKLVEEK